MSSPSPIRPIPVPEFTQIPNIVFDFWMPKLKPTSFMVLLCFCRKIFGWHKTSDTISKNQICKATGMSKNTVQSGIEELESHFLIIKHQASNEYGHLPNRYSLNVKKPIDTIYDDDQNLGGGGSNIDLGGRSKFDPGVGQNLTPQKKDLTKERHIKEITSPQSENPLIPDATFIIPLPSPSTRKINSNPKATEYILSDSSLSELPFGRAAFSFFSRLKELNPKIKEPDIRKWAKQFELLAKDGNSEEDIEKVISFVLSTHNKPSSNGFCWANVILSPTALRKQFARLWAEANKPLSKSEKEIVEAKEVQDIKTKNREWIKSRVKGIKCPSFIRISVEDEVFKIDDNRNQSTLPLYYTEKAFKEITTNTLRKFEIYL